MTRTPPQWIHALYHRRKDVRRAALAINTDYYGETLPLARLALLADPSCRTEAEKYFLDYGLYWEFLSYLLIFHKKGQLSSDAARRIIVDMGVEPAVKKLMEPHLPGWNGAGCGTEKEQDEDPLLYVLMLFWEAYPEESTRPKDDRPSPSKTFFDELKKAQNLFAITDLRNRLVNALQSAQGRFGSWVQPALDICALDQPLKILSDDNISMEMRRRTIEAFYTSSIKDLRYHPKVFEDLIKLDIARPGDNLDLWVIGGLMNLVDRKKLPDRDPYQMAADILGTEAIISSALADLEGSAPFFSLPGTGMSSFKRKLLHQITENGEQRFSYLLALMITAFNRNELGFLDDLDTGLTVNLCEDLFILEARKDIRLTPRKIETVSEVLAKKLEKSHFKRIIGAWMHSPLGEESLLGQELFGLLVRTLPTEALTREAKRMKADTLIRFLGFIRYCPAMTYGKERAVAEALKNHEHSDVLAWASERMPSAKTRKPQPPVSKETLSESERKSLIESPPDEFEDALHTICVKLRSGICDALSKRSTSHEPNPLVCAAILSSLDELQTIDREFTRFGSEDPDFLKRLDVLMVHQWQGRPLSLLGNCFLNKWERHCFAAAEQIEKLEGAYVEVLDLADGFASKVLRQCVWETILRLVSMWRYRDKGNLSDVLSPDFLERAVRSLENDDTGVLAARILVKIHQSGVCEKWLSDCRVKVRKHLPDFDVEVRKALSEWVSSAGISGNPVHLTDKTVAADVDVIAEIRTCRNIPTLVCYCENRNGKIVEEAALRLIDLGEAAIEQLAGLILRGDPPKSISILCDTISLWPRGGAFNAVKTAVFRPETPPLTRYHLGVAFLEMGDVGAKKAVFKAVNTESDTWWFKLPDWQRLLDLGVSEPDLAEAVVVSPQPHAYRSAVEFFLQEDRTNPQKIRCSLLAFLETGTLHRDGELRERAAIRLLELGVVDGIPVVLKNALTQGISRYSSAIERASELDPDLPENICETALFAGHENVSLHGKIPLLHRLVKNPRKAENLLTRILRETRLLKTRQKAAAVLLRDGPPEGMLIRLAETCAWGIQTGLELMGQHFGIKMLVTGEIGHTRMESSDIHVTPLPILKREQNGSAIVRGVIVHELGHHLYHGDDESIRVWNETTDPGLRSLMNLVEDEHLERNLRAMNDAYGDYLKQLAAYVFQHSEKEIPVEKLLESFGIHAFPGLMEAGIAPGVEKGKAWVNGGTVWHELERQGDSFARFVRALRMGLGNRHNDSKVAAGLGLFKKRFRQSSAKERLAIATKLREIFGERSVALSAMFQDEILSPSENELTIHAQGITAEKLDEAMERILNPQREKQSPLSKTDSKVRWINASEDTSFDTIHTIRHLPCVAESRALYALKVARHAAQMRRFLLKLGLVHIPEGGRVKGHRLDRPRLRQLVLHGDPRILVTRKLVVSTDLYLGIVIDCSGSMEMNDNIEKAKRFGALLAEAAKGLSGIDVGVFGFTDDTIYDAGTAGRCAVHALEAGGGNNDAAGLWHAAQKAMASRRRAKLLVMISDGSPTECSVEALRVLVQRLMREGISCAQVAVRGLDEEDVCFPDYLELEEGDLDAAVRRFGGIVAKLVLKAIRV